MGDFYAFSTNREALPVTKNWNAVFIPTRASVLQILSSRKSLAVRWRIGLVSGLREKFLTKGSRTRKYYCAEMRQGTGDRQGMNDRFLRTWSEVNAVGKSGIDRCGTREEAFSSGGSKWFPYNKGGNLSEVEWELSGIRSFDSTGTGPSHMMLLKTVGTGIVHRKEFLLSSWQA